MQLRSAYVTGPRWVRIMVLLIAGTAVAIALSATTRAWTGTFLACLALGLAIVAAVAEPWDRRRLARTLGWQGDPAALVAVGVEVDSGRVPTATGQERELARRYATHRLESYRGGTKFAVFTAVYTAGLVVFLASTVVADESVLPLVPAALLLVHTQYRLWVLRPRYRRTVQALRNTEWEWAEQRVSTATSSTTLPEGHR